MGSCQHHLFIKSVHSYKGTLSLIPTTRPFQLPSTEWANNSKESPPFTFPHLYTEPTGSFPSRSPLSKSEILKGPSQKYLEANEVKYFSPGGGGRGRRFHGNYYTFSKKKWLHACVYHHRMKPKVGRNFTSERGGEGVKGEVKNNSLHWLQGIFETVP